MALTNQPYLPLYVNDWLSNTKLKSCTALAHGIMINAMLLMHKEEDYGIILLKQKFKQTDKQIKNFALQLAKVLTFDLLEIETGLIELLDEGCLFIDGDILKCKRMIKDADLSLKRSLSGSKGGKETMKKPPIKNDFASTFAQAKSKAKPEYEYIIETVIEYLNKKVSSEFKPKTKDTITVISARIKEGYKIDDFKKVIDIKTEKWLHDASMKDYLRPATLFGTKFESYLNEIPKTIKSKFTR
jgi:uncharacterized phage protein (TIGR02220 family)